MTSCADTIGEGEAAPSALALAPAPAPALALAAMTHREHARPGRDGVVVSIPLMEYDAACRLQRRMRDERLAEKRPDTLVLLEHQPVMTLGRTTKPAHWDTHADALARQGIPVRESDRGGSVTYHGPGQVVGYPVVRLKTFCSGPKMYVRMLEDVVIRVLADWGIEGYRVDMLPGVWVRHPDADAAAATAVDAPAKIAAMGVKITRGVTTHGFALNVTVNLAPFHDILPCGIDGRRVTSMAAILGRRCESRHVREHIARHFGDVFGLAWREPIRDVDASESPASADVDVCAGHVPGLVG